MGKWYWPWETSYITDEVFVFKHQPTFFNKNKGELWRKVYCDSDFFNAYENKDKLCVALASKANDQDEDTGYVNKKHLRIIDIPLMKTPKN